MEKEKILNDLEEIFRSVLEEENLILTKEMKMSDIRGWDSLSHINVIEGVEKKFNIHFSVGEIVVLKTISGLINLIQTKLV